MPPTLTLQLHLPPQPPLPPLTYTATDHSTPQSPATITNPEEIHHQLEQHTLTLHTPLRITLHDPQNILAARRPHGFHGATATLHLHADPSDDLPLLHAVLDDDGIRCENDNTFTLTLPTPTFVLRHRETLRSATPDLLPRLPDDTVGRPLPRIYGRPHRARALLVDAPAETRLARGLTETDREAIVRDAARFPQNTPLWIRIDDEELHGAFDGNRFRIDQRGRTLAHGVLDADMAQPTLAVLRNVEVAHDHAFVGYRLRAYEQERRIVGVVAATRTLALDQPFEDAVGQPLRLSQGTPCEIVAPAASHPAGATVFARDGDWIYLLADHPLAAVHAVEGTAPVEPTQRVDGLTLWQGQRGPVALPVGWWRADPHDTTTFPALGHPVATLRMPLPPRLLGFASDHLDVHLEGVPRDDDTRLLDDDGEEEESGIAPLTNPAEILRDLLCRGGAADVDAFDPDTWENAARARNGEACAFALDQHAPLLRVLRELAQQARLRLHWRDGKIHVHPLRPDDGFDTAREALREHPDRLPVLARRDLVAGQTQWTQSDPDEVVTTLVARYRARGRDEAIVVVDPDAARRHGERVRLWDVWAYESRADVARLADAWLRRWRHRYDVVRLETFLAAVPLHPGDAVAFPPDAFDFPPRDEDGAPIGPLVGRVVSTRYRPAAIVPDGRPDRVALDVELPRWAGCRAACEIACEAAACESADCELSCTATAETACALACESRCEAACELACTLACEAVCQTACMVARQSVDTSCRSAEETGCATDCEAACQVDVETTCSDGCEVACQTCCEIACESHHREQPRIVRRVTVVEPPAQAGGSVLVREAPDEGQAPCPPFRARDPFDRAPAEGECVSVYLDGQAQWVVVPGGRDAKVVDVLSKSGRECVVRERTRDGSAWGDPFTAWTLEDE